ncbi:MAG: hypothetical protein B7Z47_00745 [Chthoniobacter sp. 12-60-6]|nr:MAG: hypothetical protein B7Z47_00745 [Chthoniobacter sp. 12-60-6]
MTHLIINRGTVITTAANGLGGGSITFNQLGRIIVRAVDGTTYDLAETMNFSAGAIGEFSVDNTGALASDFVINQNGVVNLGSGGVGATVRFNLADVASKLNLTGGVVLGGNSSISVEGGNLNSFVTISGIISDGGSGYSLAVNDDQGAWAVTNTFLRLTGLNTFSGNLALGEGTLQFSTVTNAGGAASSLGQGSAITMGTGTLSFIGGTSQSTDRPLTLTAAGTLSANGTSGATITYTGAVSTAGNSLNLTGTGEGFITGGVTQTGVAADINVNSGIWHLSTTTNTLSDDIIVTATSTGTAVMNLDTTGILAYTTGTSNGLYIRDGGVINLNAHDVNGAANSGGLDFILIGDTPTGAPGTLNTNTFNITVPRLDLGTLVAGRTGIVLGSGIITATYTGTDYGQGFRFFDGSISAGLAGVSTILKQGIGTVTISGNNSGLTGTVAATRLDSGTVILDFTSDNNNKISAVAALDLRGVLLILNGSAAADTSQTVASTTLGSSGATTITLNSGAGHSVTLNLGAITRAAGSQDGTLRVNLPDSGAVTTTSNNLGTTGVLGGWATVANATGTWFATNSAGTGLGNIVAVTTSAKNDVSTWLAGDQITDTVGGFTGTVSGVNINTLRFDAASGSTLNVAGGGVLNIASGGILMTSNVTAGASTITSGILSSTTSELIFIQDSTSQTLTVASAIRINHSVTKSGSGTLVLSGNNTYTDETEIQAGILQVSGGNAIGDTSLVTLSDDTPSMLQLLGNETIGRLTGGSASAGIDQLAVVDVGTFALTINQTGSTTYAGLLTGSGSVIKTGAGNMLFTNASSGFTGSVTINMGLLYFSGIGSSSASSFTLNSGSSFLIDNNGTTTVGTRVLDAAGIIMNSANGSWSGETIVSGLSIRRNQASTLNETVGVVTAASGANYARLEATVAGATAAIIADNIVRQNGATLDARGTNMSATTGARAQLRIGTAANQTSFIASMIGGGSTTLGTKNISIVPWAIAEDILDVGVADTNMGNSLATYVSGQGFRALNLTTEYTTYSAAAATENVRQSLSADLTPVWKNPQRARHPQRRDSERHQCHGQRRRPDAHQHQRRIPVHAPHGCCGQHRLQHHTRRL